MSAQLVPYRFQNGPLRLPLSQLDADLDYVSGKWPSVKDHAYGAKGDGTTNDTVALQNAITANYGGVLIIPPGNYLYTSQINILQRITILGFGSRISNLVCGTPNMNGFVIGDGTVGTRQAVSSTIIRDVGFYAKPGLAACSSGSFVFANYAVEFEMRNCSFDGRDNGGASKFFNGVSAFQLEEYRLANCVFIGLLGQGHTTSSTLPANLCTDGRIDDCKFQNITQEAIYFGPTTGGMVITKPIMFANSSWAIKIDSPSGSGNNVNFFIDTPDIECDGTGNGIYAKQGSDVQVDGGWIGANTATAPIALQVDSTAGVVEMRGTQTTTANVVLSGNSCKLIGCDIGGDNATTPYGVTINSTATDTEITGGIVRQWINSGIRFVGSPARCRMTGVGFRNNLNNAIGDTFPSTGAPPVFMNCYDDATNFTLTAAAVLLLRHGMRWIFVTGATHITSMIGIGFGAEITILADAGGVNIDNTVSIALKSGINVTITAGAQMGLQFDGSKWRETWRSF